MQSVDEGEFSRERSTHGVSTCLEVLSQPGGASLQLARGSAGAEAVVLMTFEPGGWLQLDLTAAAHLEPLLKSGAAFNLVGQLGGKFMRSQELKAQSWDVVDGRLVLYCGYPEYFDILQRRETFRAELRLGMKAMATVRCADQEATGQLRNLSVQGCLVEFTTGAEPLLTTLTEEATAADPGSAAGSATATKTATNPDAVPAVMIRLAFPDGTDFHIEGFLRHHVIDRDAPYIRMGFQFVPPTPQQERQLWQFVREIEREAVRFIGEDYSTLEPSPLFRSPQSGAARRLR